MYLKNINSDIIACFVEGTVRANRRYFDTLCTHKTKTTLHTVLTCNGGLMSTYPVLLFTVFAKFKKTCYIYKPLSKLKKNIQDNEK